ncbi:AAA-like domain protein [Phycisphaerae bacterium RAS2]|nr:AAA-like domain protein [Phycisphaerae bacterium RAS2]
MRWLKKPRTIDLKPFENYLAAQPQLSLPATLDPTGPALLWTKPLDIRLSRIDLEAVWRRLGDRAWEILQRRRMKEIFHREPPSEFARYLATLHRSSPEYREEIFVGLRHPKEEPLFVPRDVFKNHAYILGGSGSGKTSHALAQLIVQLAEGYIDQEGNTHAPPPILIVDLKQNGDRYLRCLAQQIAEARGQPLRFFSVDPEYQSLNFDPFYCIRSVAYPLKRSELFLKALSMIYPEGYGSDFFTDEQRTQLNEILYHDRPTTMNEMIAFIRHATTGKSGNKDARGLYSALQALEYAKNVHTDGAPIGRDQLIDFDRFYEESEVLYVHLDSRALSLLSADVGKLILFCLLETASRREKEGRKTQCFVAVDEFHRLAARNVVEMLEDARSAGVGFILAHQSSSSMKTREADLYGSVFENTSFKQCLTLEDPRVIELFSLISGRTTERRLGGSTSESTSKGTTTSHSSSHGTSHGESTTSPGGPLAYATNTTSDSTSSSSGSSSGTAESKSTSETKSWQEEKLPALTPEMITIVNDTNLMSLMHVKGTGGRCLTPTGGVPLLVQGLYPFVKPVADEMGEELWPLRKIDDSEWYFQEARPSLPKRLSGDKKSRPSAGGSPQGQAGASRPSRFTGANDGDRRKLEARVRELAERLSTEMLEEPMNVRDFSRVCQVPIKMVVEAGAAVGLDLSARQNELSPTEVRRLKRSLAARKPREEGA